MSLWDWLIEAIIGSRTAGRSATPNSRAGQPIRSGPAVATLEPSTDTGESPEVPESAPWYQPEGATLLEPAPVANPGLSAEGVALEASLTSQLDVNNLVLPSLPRVPEAVLRHLHKSDYSFRAVSDLIAEDQVTATVVLRAANCALWGSRKVTSILDAVTRLGINALRTLMLSESLRAAAFCKERRNRELGGMLWHRAVAAGCIMRSLAEFTDDIDAEDAFVMGLLHDVGNVIVLHAVDNHEALTHATINLETFEYLCYECHELFGELIAEKWNLPPRLKDLIQTHHRYPTADDPFRTERLHLMLADMINHMIGFGPAAAYDLLASNPVRDLSLSGKPGLVQLLRSLPAQIEQTIAGT